MIAQRVGGTQILPSKLIECGTPRTHYPQKDRAAFSNLAPEPRGPCPHGTVTKSNTRDTVTGRLCNGLLVTGPSLSSKMHITETIQEMHTKGHVPWGAGGA